MYSSIHKKCFSRSSFYEACSSVLQCKTCIFFLILFIGYVLRLQDFAGHWIWQDELTTLDQVYRNYYESTSDAPLYQYILKIFSLFTGSITVDFMRFITINISIFVPILAFYFTKYIAGYRAALVAALLFATLEHSLAYAINIRPYALFSITSFASFYYFLRYTQGHNVGIHLGLSLFLCSLTHLLTAHIFLAMFCTFAYCTLASRNNIHGLSPAIFTKRRLAFLVAILGIAGLIGNIWIIGRYNLIVRGAIDEPASFFIFVKFFFQMLPIGHNIPWYFVLLAWVSFGIGLKRLYDAYPPFCIFAIIFFVLVGMICWLTYGDRVGWGWRAARYFTHLLTLTITIVAIGLSTAWMKLSQKLSKQYLFPVLYIILAGLLVINSYFDNQQRYFVHDELLTLFSQSLKNDVDAIFYKSRHPRNAKVILLLQAYHSDRRPLYFVRGSKPFLMTPVQKNNFSTQRIPLDNNNLIGGVYLAQAPCISLHSYLRTQGLKLKLVSETNDKKNGVTFFYCRFMK